MLIMEERDSISVRRDSPFCLKVNEFSGERTRRKFKLKTSARCYPTIKAQKVLRSQLRKIARLLASFLNDISASAQAEIKVILERLFLPPQGR